MAKTASDAGPGKAFSEDTIVVLLAANGLFTIKKTSYDAMSSLDGIRTADGFEHQFRSVVKKANVL